LLSFIFIGIELLFACNAKRPSYQNPPDYDLTKPYIYKLPVVLDEISGITYYPKDSSLFAIQDEKGLLFKIHLTNPLRVEEWKFRKGADYEDIALVDSTFFVLKSKGIIEKFKFAAADSVLLQTIDVPVKGKNEFETLFYDSSLHKLILICKDCHDDKKDEISTWTMDPVTDSIESSFVINTSMMQDELNKKERIKPSAGAVNPLTGEWYIISSINKALIVLNKDHSLKQLYKLDPVLFKQPEGLTFTPKGDLIISNESADEGEANLLFFKRTHSKNPQ
jgi:uncharacterized protein YjiK